MADVLIYWRDYAANWAYQFAGDRAFYWHSSAKCIAELQPGDRMWMVTSGKGLREDTVQAAFLVGVCAVREVIDNTDDDPAFGCGRSETGDTDGDDFPDCVDQCPDVDDDVFAPECIGTIPTVSHWGLMVMALVLLSAGKIYFRARRSVIQGP